MQHSKYIHRCLELALRGQGKVGTNPMVGAVLVRAGEIIADAWHEEFGAEHAERLLIKNFDQEIRPDDAFYVNLEPCSHRGKTPPCTDVIIEAGIKRVVFGMKDPNPAVNGRGVEILRNAGVELIGPVDSVRCRRFNRGFVSLHEQGRPWVTLKRAQTRMGTIANEDGSTLKITSPQQDEWSHEYLRATHDAILVGVETVIQDDPLLTTRSKNTKIDQVSPLRIVLDPEMRIPLDAKILTGDMAKGTCIITASDPDSSELKSRSVRIFQLPIEGECFVWDKLWSVLKTPSDDFHGIKSILVEGGPTTWNTFKEAGVVDEEVVLVGK